MHLPTRPVGLCISNYLSHLLEREQTWLAPHLLIPIWHMRQVLMPLQVHFTGSCL